jgi:extracellular factor (EF) 3-hydroxypalmitic acid methyl ester biosynthesis protein
VHGDTEGAPRLALIDRMRRDFVPTVLDYYGRLDAAVRGADPQDLPALRQFSQRTLDDLMLQAPLLYRARNKPLGYPGDFECMNDMYFRNFRGTSLFARALQLASCLSPPAEAVRARKDLIKDEIHRLVASHSGDRPLRIASIAAGPAQEIFEFLQEAKELPGRLEIVLFDQDKLALSFAQRRIAPLVEARWSSQVRVVFLNDSIKRLLHDPTLFGTLGPFDLLFSTGLFDYLRFPTAVNLCRNLHLNTAPGGRAFVGNMDPANPARWVFEHHLEWYLIYRTSGEMLEFGRTALPDARLEMAPDRTFLNPFLVMHKD